MNLEFVRPLPINSHPVMTQKYIVPTPSIGALYARISKCIKLRVPGSIIYAMTRFGKTYAARYVSILLSQDFPGIVSFTFGCVKKKIPSESAFFTILLEAVDHDRPDSGTTPQKRIRLINKLLDLLIASKQNLLVVFADEAQKLQMEEYEWLREVHDQLEKKGYRMITFLIGQPQLKNQKSALKEARQTQIVGRFMIDDIEFHGVCSVEDAASCLLGYDTACFPSESEWTFTRFFLPEAWSRGIRLQDQASALWAEFQNVHDEGGFRTPLEIPMTYFARSVEIALTDISKDSVDFEFTPLIWKRAVEESKFAAAEEELLLNMSADDAS